MKTLKFNYQLEAQNNLELESLSNCCIRATNELEYAYYLIIRTIAGKTYFAECGPLLNNEDKRLPNGFLTRLSIVEFNDKKLAMMINGFLNDKSRKINDASVIELSEALKNFKNLKDFMESL